MTTRPVSCLYHSFTPCFFSIPFSPFSSRARHAPFFRPFELLPTFQTSLLSLLQRWINGTLVTPANNLIAFLSRSQLFSRLFVPELRLSKNEQFIPVYRFRSSRSVEESPNQFASDQSPPFQRPTFAGSPFPSPLLHAAIVFQ